MLDAHLLEEALEDRGRFQSVLTGGVAEVDVELPVGEPGWSSAPTWRATAVVPMPGGPESCAQRGRPAAGRVASRFSRFTARSRLVKLRGAGGRVPGDSEARS
ncbi:hypothetical protein [Streptomyces microflavus]|uniref:hypothetical protein n=1 Tax=Streptomyces microflavus TaxID=1919 RepID=UPI00339E8B92